MPNALILTRCAAILSVLGIPASAAAYAEGRLAIELLVARDELPGYACVVHVNGADTGGMRMPRSQPAADDRFELVKEKDGYAVRARGGNALGGVRDSEDPTTLAFGVLARTGDEAACSAGRCSGQVEHDDWPLRVTCAANAAGDPTRVLLLRLNLPGDREGEVHSVSFDGSIVAVSGTWGEKDRPTVHVIKGGHYFPGDASSARMDNRMQLRVQTLCVRRELQLPPVVRGSASPADGRPRVWEIAIDPRGGPFEDLFENAPAACRKTLCAEREVGGCVTDTATVMLGRSFEQRRVTAVLKLPPPTGDGADHPYETRLEARFDQESIPNPLVLRAFGMRFEWLTRCEHAMSRPQRRAGTRPHAQPPSFDRASCPRADLIEAGVSCEASSVTRVVQRRAREQTYRPACVYTCESPSGAPAFALPLTVRFAAGDQEDAWREQLSHIDQKLSGYTPESVRQFAIATPAEVRLPRADGDALESLSIWTPSGIRYEFSIEDVSARWPVLAIPGGRCGAPLNYQYEGTRSFAEDTTQIERGRIVIPPPSRSGVRWTWGVLVAPSLVATLVEGMNDHPPANPALMMKLATRYQPTFGSFGHGWTLDLGFHFLLSRAPYYPLDVPDSVLVPQAAHTSSWRIGAEAGVMKAMPPWLAFKDGWGFGASLGAGRRLPLYARDATALNGGQWYGAIGPFVRSRVGGPMWVELSAQYILGETTTHFESKNMSLNRAPSEKHRTSHTVSASFGLRFWL